MYLWIQKDLSSAILFVWKTSSGESAKVSEIPQSNSHDLQDYDSLSYRLLIPSVSLFFHCRAPCKDYERTSSTTKLTMYVGDFAWRSNSRMCMRMLIFKFRTTHASHEAEPPTYCDEPHTEEPEKWVTFNTDLSSTYWRGMASFQTTFWCRLVIVHKA